MNHRCADFFACLLALTSKKKKLTYFIKNLYRSYLHYLSIIVIYRNAGDIEANNIIKLQITLLT